MMRWLLGKQSEDMRRWSEIERHRWYGEYTKRIAADALREYHTPHVYRRVGDGVSA